MSVRATEQAIRPAPARQPEGGTQMIHRPAASGPRPVRRGIGRTRRTLTTLSGLAGFLAVTIGLAPAAWAAFPPPEPPVAPPSPPPAAAAAHFPLWAVVVMVAATVVLSVATTLVTLSLEHLRRARRMPAAAAEPQAGEVSPAITPPPDAGPGEILASHHYAAGYEMYRPGSR
jgi:hypothetical protein